jgi:dihydroflavonol-4-reductase
MLIAVTGGTGYVGAHTVAAFLDSGHQVRVLVEPGWRNDALVAILGARGAISWRIGDIHDHLTRSRLLGGCDALFHAADVDAYASEALMRDAAAVGLDPIVSVSSYSALFRPPKSTTFADLAAERMQEEGMPVVVTYPSSVVGPALATAPGSTEAGWDPFLRFGFAPRLDGVGMQMIDVKDVAAVHARAMRAGQGPRRYFCAGQFLAFDDLIAALEEGSGRPIRRLPLPPALFRAIGRVLSPEAADLLTAAVPADDSPTLDEWGHTWNSPREAIIETFTRRSQTCRDQHAYAPARP